MKFTCLNSFFFGILVGIIMSGFFILILSSTGNLELGGTSPSMHGTPNNSSIKPVSERSNAFEDELLASDILKSGKTLHDIYTQVTAEISGGDLNGAMITLDLHYAEELSEAKSRANTYYIGPEGESLLDSWNRYLDELPMVIYLTHMQIENIGKNYYAKAHADKISAEKILSAADKHLQTTLYEAEKISGEQRIIESELGLNRVSLPFSNEDI